MKEVLEKLSSKHLFTSFVSLETSFLQTRRKMKVFKGIDTHRFFHLVFSMPQKSRFVYAHAVELLDFEAQVSAWIGHSFKYKALVLNAPLCSKARILLEAKSWSIV